MSRTVRGLHAQGDGALRARGLQIQRSGRPRPGKVNVQQLHGEMGMQAQVSRTHRGRSSWARRPPGRLELLLAWAWARGLQVPPGAAAQGMGGPATQGPSLPSLPDQQPVLKEQIPEFAPQHFCQQEVKVTISGMFPVSSHRTCQSAGRSLA